MLELKPWFEVSFSTIMFIFHNTKWNVWYQNGTLSINTCFKSQVIMAESINYKKYQLHFAILNWWQTIKHDLFVCGFAMNMINVDHGVHVCHFQDHSWFFRDHTWLPLMSDYPRIPILAKSLFVRVQLFPAKSLFVRVRLFPAFSDFFLKPFLLEVFFGNLA